MFMLICFQIKYVIKFFCVYISFLNSMQRNPFFYKYFSCCVIWIPLANQLTDFLGPEVDFE